MKTATARVWKDVLLTGTVKVPTGDPAAPVRTETFTPQDIENACQVGNAKLSEGWQVPVSWDHQGYEPINLSAGDRIASIAKHTCGFVGQYRVGSEGQLQAGLDVPDPADVKQLKKTGFVSPRLRWDWTDTTGKTWPGITVGHVAVTPYPVQHKQRPFEMSQAANPRSPINLSLGDYMADDKKKKPDADMDGIPDAIDAAPTDPAEKGPEAATSDAPKNDVPAPQFPESNVLGDVQLKSALTALASLGIVLPPDTTAANLAERINIAAIAIKGAEAMEDLNDPDDEYADPNDPNAHKVTVDGQQPTETKQTMPLSMSLAEQTQTGKAVNIARRTLTERVARLQRTGRITPVIAQKLLAETRSINLSFADATGELIPNPVTLKIEAYEALPKSKAWSASGRKKNGKLVDLSQAVREVEPPAGTPDGRSDDEFFSSWDKMR